MREQTYDAIVIGAGLGGLLSAAQLLQRGKRVVVLERLPHCGGRFTAKTYQGVQISTGAVHMVPFGSSGVLAGMLRRLRIPHHFLMPMSLPPFTSMVNNTAREGCWVRSDSSDCASPSCSPA